MRKNYFLFFVLVSFIFVNHLRAQTLTAGDIAIIGVNEDAGPVGTEDHSFTWIALTDIPAGEVIYFTEQGVNINSMSWFGNTEGHYSWTAPAGGLSCGSIVHIYENGASSEVLIALGGGTMSGLLSGSGWNLSSGDQVLAYQASAAQSSLASTTFITGIHLNDDLADGETNGWTSTSYNSTGVAQCHLPPGLTNGVNCISLYSPSSPENDNNKYTGTLTGNVATLRALINSPFSSGNWSGDNGATATVGISVGDYSPNVTCAAPCTDPTIPTVTYNPSTVCTGNTTTLNISGTLNDATQWSIYTGSCGGTLLGTTATSSFVVTPGSPSTTYYVRGEGGCVTPGSCGTVTVNVTSLDDASFSYSTGSYCVNGSDPTPTITGSAGGTFSSTAGLSINAGTGAIDVSASTPGTYTVTYATAGTCPNSSNVSVTITQVDASTTLNDTTITSNAVGASYQWLDCNNGMSIISGETNSSYTATANGSYAVQVTQNGCSDISACVTIATLGIITGSFNNDITIYPNPTTDFIKISGLTKTANYIIFNVLGSEIRKGSIPNSEKIDIKNLMNGVYFIKIDNRNPVKFIKVTNK